MKILISGGHLTPALAFIDYALSQHHAEVVFVGREYSQPQLHQRSQEKQEIEQRGIKFITFSSGKLHSRSILQMLKQIVLFLPSIFTAVQLMWREKPDVFLSFGGYMAVPLALAAFLIRVPIVTHEQTRTAGVANRYIAKLATIIAISHPDSAQFFPESRTVLTGNPLRKQLFEAGERPSWISTKPSLPMLYITGGNQGSQFMNMTILELLPKLTKQWFVIHQCGNPTSIMNYRKELDKARRKLSDAEQQNYCIREWISQKDLGWILGNAKAVVSRSGANTILELAALAKPAIFIPLPLTHDDEQVKNATEMVQAGAAFMLLQKEASPEKLLTTLNQLKRQYAVLKEQAQEFQKQVITDGEVRLYRVIEEVVTHQT